MIATLEEARSMWSSVIKGDGGHCPCCDRWGKIYPRTFNSTMARSLIWLATWNRDGGWCDVPNTAPKAIVRTNQLPTTRWWGLSERQPSGDSNKKNSGWWRVTERGNRFARGMITIPKKVFTYNGEVLYFDSSLIHIRDAFDTSFDYERVMLPAIPEEQFTWKQHEWGF